MREWGAEKELKSAWKSRAWQLHDYEPRLFFPAFLLASLGIVLLASASMTIAEGMHLSPFYYLIRHTLHWVVGLAGLFLLLRIPLHFWQKTSGVLFLVCLGLLICVLIPGIGKAVNGSMRWISLGGFQLQVSEFMKLAMVIYLAAYCAQQKAVPQQVRFVPPIVLLSLVTLFLLWEPDFGAAVVMVITVITMLFVAGVRLRVFLSLLLLVSLVLLALAIVTPYRMERLSTFLNPWQDAFSEGYQLTQSLIAFGRGEWFGLGLGNSVQKLFYLPEAHTDFLLAVLAEELGLVGVLGFIILFLILISRGLHLSILAARKGEWFHTYLAFGLSFLLAIQVLVNMGVNMGILPTKGLTLPFLSYGGSSLVASCLLLGLLFRISFEYGKEGVKK